VDKNPIQGIAYLINSNSPSARYLIAKASNDGTAGPRDLVSAYKWCLLAPATDKRAQDLLVTLGKQLSPDQNRQATVAADLLRNEAATGDFQSPGMTASLGGASSVTLKFETFGGEIVLPVTLQNKEKVNLMIDTGCSTSGLDARIAPRFNLSGTDVFPMTGAGADLESGTFADGVSVSAPGLEIAGARFALIPHYDFDEYMGHLLAGFIGTDILRHFVVQIDYVHHTLTFSLPEHAPPVNPAATALPMDVKRNAPFVQAAIDDGSSGPQEGKFLIDTGGGGFISLSTTFQERHPAFHLARTVSSGSTGLGGIDLTTDGQGAVILGTLRFANALLDLDRNSQGAWSSLDGGGIDARLLGRFDVTLDFPSHRLLLLPNSTFKDPVRTSYGGVAIKTTGGDYKTFEIYFVVPESPGSNIDLRKDDQVVQIDRKPTSAMTMEEVNSRIAATGTHELQILRHGTPMTFSLPVYDPLQHPEQAALHQTKLTDDNGQLLPVIDSFAVQYVGEASGYPDDVIIRASRLRRASPTFPSPSIRPCTGCMTPGCSQTPPSCPSRPAAR
jgi:hypothetical protein